MEAGETFTNFLDIQLNYLTDDYCPNINSNAKTVCNNKDSNHPRKIKEHNLKRIEKKIQNLHITKSHLITQNTFTKTL